MSGAPSELSVEIFGNHVLLTLRGRFPATEIPVLREKLLMLTEERRRTYLIDVENCRFEDRGYLELFLDLLNAIRARDSQLVLIFSGARQAEFFSGRAHLFEIYPTLNDFSRPRIWESLRRRGVSFSKKTGVRISVSIAVILGLLVLGWVLTLVLVVRFQAQELSARENALRDLEARQRILLEELKELHSAVGPLRELGVLESRTPGRKGEQLDQWIEYLERLERKRVGDSLP